MIYLYLAAEKCENADFRRLSVCLSIYLPYVHIYVYIYTYIYLYIVYDIDVHHKYAMLLWSMEKITNKNGSFVAAWDPSTRLREVGDQRWTLPGGGIGEHLRGCNWVGFREMLQETMVLPITSEGCECPLEPIPRLLQLMGLHTSGMGF